MEELKEIKGFGNYKVSNTGDIYTKDNIKIDFYLMNGYAIVNLWRNNKPYKGRVHRIVALAFIPNPENKRCVDHIDNDRLNNKVENLRWATHQENLRNSPISSRNTSGIKGVYYNKTINKYYASICSNYELMHLGFYDTIDEAKEARQKKANELFGAFVNRCEVIRNELDELELEFQKLIN